MLGLDDFPVNQMADATKEPSEQTTMATEIFTAARLLRAQLKVYMSGGYNGHHSLSADAPNEFFGMVVSYDRDIFNRYMTNADMCLI